MGENNINNLEFVRSFYQLFFQHENSYFVGSKEQALLYMQVEFDKYIPFTYIEEAFKYFIDYSIIKVTGEKLKVAPVISGRFGTLKYNSQKQLVYKKIDTNNVEDTLISISNILRSFKEVCKEFPSNDEVKILRDLEGEKGIRFTYFCSYNKRSYSYELSRSHAGESDATNVVFYMYNKNEILKIIDDLKKYDPVKEQQEKEGRYNSLQQIKEKRNQNWIAFTYKVEKFLNGLNNNQLKVSITITKKLGYLYEYQYSILQGSFSPTIIRVSEKEVQLASDNFDFRTSLSDIYINTNTSKIYFLSMIFIITFDILDNEAKDYMEFLQFYKANNIQQLDEEIS